MRFYTYILPTLMVSTTYKCPNKIRPIYRRESLRDPETKLLRNGEEVRARERCKEGDCPGTAPSLSAQWRYAAQAYPYNSHASMEVSVILSRTDQQGKEQRGRGHFHQEVRKRVQEPVQFNLSMFIGLRKRCEDDECKRKRRTRQ